MDTDMNHPVTGRTTVSEAEDLLYDQAHGYSVGAREVVSKSVCLQCGKEAVNSFMREDGAEYPIWKCSENPHHWGTR